MTDQRRVHESFHVSGEPSRLPALVRASLDDWHLLHCLVFRLRSHQHQVHQRVCQGADDCLRRFPLHGFRPVVPDALGWNICLSIPAEAVNTSSSISSSMKCFAIVPLLKRGSPSLRIVTGLPL